MVSNCKLLVKTIPNLLNSFSPPSLDGETPLLIKLLWDLRNFQEDLLALPLHKLEPVLKPVWDADQAIAIQILELCQTTR